MKFGKVAWPRDVFLEGQSKWWEPSAPNISGPNFTPTRFDLERPNLHGNTSKEQTCFVVRCQSKRVGTVAPEIMGLLRRFTQSNQIFAR